MLLADLEHIFQPQIAEGTTNLYFMIIDGDYNVIQRHPADDMAALLPMLDCFTYTGIEARMPRFEK